MASPVQIRINPAVLKWARETSGVAIDDAAKRLKVLPSAYSRWEMQESPLTLTQARALASYYKRPLAAFLLSAPPQEPGPPRDFRTLPGAQGHFERKTRLAIRRALRLRSVAKDLMQGVGRECASQVGRANIRDDPEEASRRERARLGIDAQTQRKWKNEWQAFREWRAAIECQNVLVFQIPMPVEDARGFSLTDGEPFAIVLSSSDAVRGRIFTLFHEYAHLLLRTPGVCLPQISARPQRGDADVERWCNRFAGTFLVPDSGISSIAKAGPEGLSGRAAVHAAQTIATQFKVSDQVALWRLRDLGKVSNKSFQEEMGKCAARSNRTKRKIGIVAPAKRCISENGALFISLVTEAKAKGLVTYSDVVDYLDVRLKHLPEIESSLAASAA
jgi:Zn-dependent peptidase ImmA (M78 family)